MKQSDLDAILTPKLPENPVVITTGPLLGLGDFCVYSTLPERFAQLGYDVYIDSDCKSSNPEIRELVWQHNPYIKGLSDRKPNAGYTRQGYFYDIANRLSGYRSIEAMERAHGLPPNPLTGAYGLAPKLVGVGYDGRQYYQPKPTKLALDRVVLMDYSAVSSKLSRNDILEEIKMMRSKFKEPPFLQVMHPPWIVVNQEAIIDSRYLVSSVYEYLDLLAACRAWVGSEAGGQSLAAAVRGEHDVYAEGGLEIVCKITPQTFNSRGYTYRGVDYRGTGNGADAAYWSPLEVKTMQYEVSCEIRQVEMAQRLENARG